MPPETKDRPDFRIGAHFVPQSVPARRAHHQQIAVAGDTVNVASRLLEVAKQERRRVIVTEDLFVAARGVDIGVAYARLTVPIRGRAGSLQIRDTGLTEARPALSFFERAEEGGVEGRAPGSAGRGRRPGFRPPARRKWRLRPLRDLRVVAEAAAARRRGRRFG